MSRSAVLVMAMWTERLRGGGRVRRIRALTGLGVGLGVGLGLGLSGCFTDEATTGIDSDTVTTGQASLSGTTTGQSSLSGTGTSTPSGTTKDATSGETTMGTEGTTSTSSTTGPEPEVLIVSVEDGLNDALQDPDLSVKVAFGWVTLNSSEHYGALRFAIPDVPQGATIVAAEFQVYVDGTDVDSPRLEIHGELAPNPPIFSAELENISARPRTLASVIWTEDDIGEGWVQSPSIVSVIQELVDQPAWMPNQHIVLILDATTQASNLTPFEFRQHDSGADFAARLGIQWLAP